MIYLKSEFFYYNSFRKMINLNKIALISVVTGIVCMLIILTDILSGKKQNMKIMNFVWPITGLYAGLFALIAYFTIGRKYAVNKAMNMSEMKGMAMNKEQRPYWQSVLIGTLHCGAGCTLGDIIAETLMHFYPVELFGMRLYGAWVVDFIFAFFIGIIFQYNAIKPMKNLQPREALIAALKADTLSLTAWQVGMYGGMAIAVFIIFRQMLDASSVIFWFVMQIVMILGFFTAYPVNWWLIKTGIKERM